MKYLKSYNEIVHNEIVHNEIDGLESIDEKFKEILLAILMLAGANLSSRNSRIATTALDNTKIIKNIDNIINNRDDQFYDNISKDAAKLIKTNADEVKKKLAKNKYIKISKINDIDSVYGKLRQGYALSNIEVKYDTILTKGSLIELDSIIEIESSADNFFKTGTFNLTTESLDSINYILNKISELDGNIYSIEIISSTDKEPIKIGNNKLAELRAESVSNEIKKLYNGEIKITTLPNSGEDIYSSKMSISERNKSREKTSKYRYVKIKIKVSYDIKVNKEDKYKEIVKKYEFKLVKSYINAVGSDDDKYRNKRRYKNNTTCKSIKIMYNKKRHSSLCPVF